MYAMCLNGCSSHIVSERLGFSTFCGDFSFLLRLLKAGFGPSLVFEQEFG